MRYLEILTSRFPPHCTFVITTTRKRDAYHGSLALFPR